MNKRRWMQHKSYHNSRAGKDAPNQSRSLQAQPPSSPLAPGMRATPKRAGRRRTQRSPADVPVPISTPPCSDGTAPAHCTGRQRPRAIPPRRSRSCPCRHPSRRGGPGGGPGWTVVPASGSCLYRYRCCSCCSCCASKRSQLASWPGVGFLRVRPCGAVCGKSKGATLHHAN